MTISEIRTILSQDDVAEELLQDLSTYYRNGRGHGGSAGNGEMSG